MVTLISPNQNLNKIPQKSESSIISSNRGSLRNEYSKYSSRVVGNRNDSDSTKKSGKISNVSQ